MTPNHTWIAERARSLGFALCGVVRAHEFPELERFEDWLGRGYAGEMRYLEDPRRVKPALVMDDVQSVIVCAMHYNTAHPYSTEAAASVAAPDGPPRGWISRYAWGDDYHEVLWEKLNALGEALKEKFPEPFTARAYADTGPIAERVFAKHAGLGWIGKNTLLLNESVGSWFFLGVLLTSLDLPPSLGPADTAPPDLCGNCRQCLDACPTEALVEPYVLDARRCISYLTIELRGSIPAEFREAMGRHIFGCDICQDVCPYNRQAPTSSSPVFQPRMTADGKSLYEPDLEWMAAMDEREFRELFRGSAVKRTKWAGLLRNACVAIGNSGPEPGTEGHERLVKLLSRLAESGISTVAESARWALSRIQQKPA